MLHGGHLVQIHKRCRVLGKHLPTLGGILVRYVDITGYLVNIYIHYGVLGQYLQNITWILGKHLSGTEILQNF